MHPMFSSIFLSALLFFFNNLLDLVKPEIQKGPQWRKVASRGDGTTIAELVCQAEGIPRVDFSWEKNGVLMDLANPRLEISSLHLCY